MPMPHVNSYVPGAGGVISIVVFSFSGRKPFTPKSGNTTSSEQLELSWRSNTRRMGLPAAVRITAGVDPPRTVTATSFRPAAPAAPTAARPRPPCARDRHLIPPARSGGPARGVPEPALGEEEVPVHPGDGAESGGDDDPVS